MLNNLVAASAETTLAQLAWDAYESNTGWRDIAEANEIDIFQSLPIGQQLRLPKKAELVEAISERLRVTTGLDLSTLKQPEALHPHALLSWVL